MNHITVSIKLCHSNLKLIFDCHIPTYHIYQPSHVHPTAYYIATFTVNPCFEFDNLWHN